MHYAALNPKQENLLFFISNFPNLQHEADNNGMALLSSLLRNSPLGTLPIHWCCKHGGKDSALPLFTPSLLATADHIGWTPAHYAGNRSRLVFI
jgi:hypothetical protein